MGRKQASTPPDASAGKGGKGLGPVAITTIIAVVLIVVLGVYIAIHFLFLGATDFSPVVKDGMILVLLSVGLLFMIGPTSVQLHQEDMVRRGTNGRAPGADSLAERRERAMFWTTRLRTLLTVALTLVLLVMVVSWTADPDSVHVPIAQPAAAGGGLGNNTTANSTVVLSPFVQAFVDIYKIVLVFFFGSVAAENISKLFSPESNKDEGGQKRPPDAGEPPTR